jgi:predicted NAD-dependent protein-ADP-ribosyltransferase YbiA (DUF1768 family)
MVKSILNSSLNYDEEDKLDEGDVNYKTVLYEIELFKGYDAQIALGNVSYKYISNNILYYPVYLIDDGYVVCKIGVYEVNGDKNNDLLDMDGYLDIEKLDNSLPLYFSFFSEEFLKEKLNYKKSYSKNLEVVNEEIKSKLSYREQEGDEWIKKYMKSANYSLIDNEGGGDCLYAVIRDAFKDVKDVSVEILRDLVSKNATEKNFSDFKEHYDMYSGELLRLKQQLVVIKKTHNEMNENFKQLKDRSEKKLVAAEINRIVNEYNEVKKTIGGVKEMIKEFKWMKRVETFGQFKEKIKTCDFWADSWAINILEKALNIKIIILSSNNYEVNDLDNVLQCGDFVDEEIINKNVFQPEHYILTSYSGDHYKLITYNESRLFTFNNLPQSIKDMIANKCMEKDNGVYNFIPEFKKMKDGKKVIKEKLEEKQGSPIKEDSISSEKTPSSVANSNFDEDIVFLFYAKSKNSKPGKGSGEKIPLEKEKLFYTLSKIDNWRRVLSNLYVTDSPMVIDNKKWASVENYYQAQKFKKGNPKFYNEFSLDSDSELSKRPSVAKAAGGKTGKYKNVQVRPKKVKMDEDFYTSKENERSIYKAQLSKYKNDELASKVLLETKNAKLTHYVRGDKPVVFYTTMKIRDALTSQKS